MRSGEEDNKGKSVPYHNCLQVVWMGRRTSSKQQETTYNATMDSHAGNGI